MQTIDKKILSRFYGRGRGHVATQKDFVDLGSRSHIDNALSRLAQNGKLRRIARGLYEYPRTSPILGELSPDLEKVAAAMAGREGIRLQETGAYAANLLHLSEQVPMKVVFLTDGVSKKATIGNQSIELRKASPKRMQLEGRISGLVFEALRYIGEKHIADQHIETLQNTLTLEQKGKVLHDLREAPAWMHTHIREITQERSNRTTSEADQPQPETSKTRFAPADAERIVEAEKQLIYAACPGIGAGERSKGLDLPDQPRIRLHHQHLPHLSTMCTTGGFFLSGHKKEEGHQ